MAPAGNHRHSQDCMDNTFYLTNIVPQDFSNNSGWVHGAGLGYVMCVGALVGWFVGVFVCVCVC